MMRSKVTREEVEYETTAEAAFQIERALLDGWRVEAVKSGERGASVTFEKVESWRMCDRRDVG